MPIPQPIFSCSVWSSLNPWVPFSQGRVSSMMDSQSTAVVPALAAYTPMPVLPRTSPQWSSPPSYIQRTRALPVQFR